MLRIKHRHMGWASRYTDFVIGFLSGKNWKLDCCKKVEMEAETGNTHLMLESRNKCCCYNVPELAVPLGPQDTGEMFLCHMRERRTSGAEKKPHTGAPAIPSLGQTVLLHSLTSSPED